MDGNTEDDDTEEYDVSESLRSFRRAGSKATEGIGHLYHGGKEQLADQHVVVKGVITFGLWFTGNWVYTRIASSFVNVVVHLFSTVPTDSVLAILLGFLGGDAVLSTAHLLGISTGALLGQNRLQTRKLKDIESKLTTMGEKSPAATDGGSQDPEYVSGGGGLGGAIAGVSIGISFGPGGVLAGAYLGYVVGERLTRIEVTEITSNRS